MNWIDWGWGWGFREISEEDRVEEVLSDDFEVCLYFTSYIMVSD